MYKIIISFGIYTFFFIKLGNTVFRRDSSNNINFSLIPLFTTGFIYPIKSIYNLILIGEFNTLYHFLLFESTNLANPYTSYYVVNFLYYLISNNLF